MGKNSNSCMMVVLRLDKIFSLAYHWRLRSILACQSWEKTYQHRQKVSRHENEHSLSPKGILKVPPELCCPYSPDYRALQQLYFYPLSFTTIQAGSFLIILLLLSCISNPTQKGICWCLQVAGIYSHSSVFAVTCLWRASASFPLFKEQQ